MNSAVVSSEEINQLFHDLFPLCRSISGEGVRNTLTRLQKISKFSTHEIKSGTSVFDWTIPDEWRVREAYIETLDGKRIVSFSDNNLHLVGYSCPFQGELSFDELVDHLHTLPEQPDAIPYRTSYYKKDWGFCLSYQEYSQMDQSARYRVVIDAEHFSGSLTLGEIYLPGTSGEDYIIHSYCCHPSMGNDNLSGIVLWIYLLRYLSEKPRRHGYRFVIAPETIGALAYLHLKQNDLDAVKGGLILTTVAGPGPFSLKESFSANSLVDRAAKCVLGQVDPDFICRPFDVLGSDERQYSTPGFRIPMITIAQSQYYHYAEYHTSLDNLDCISTESLLASFNLYINVINVLEGNAILHSLSPFGEPMLGKRGIYPMLGGGLNTEGSNTSHDRLRTTLWVTFLADGKHTLLDVAEKTGVSFSEVEEIALLLEQKGLLKIKYPERGLR